MDVQASQLRMHFDDADRRIEVFRDVSLSIPSGESVAIVGASGVGKTTLLHILGALETPTGGSVHFGDTDIVQLQQNPDALSAFRGRHIGLVFQSHHLLPEFDALENVALPLLIQGMERAAAFASASDLLERVGLGHRFTHRPGALSGGEQQRVAIARALVAEPAVVLADEPTGNLDVKTGASVIETLLGLQKQRKTTLILVTHSPELAGMLDKVVELTPSGLVPGNVG